MSTNFEQLGVEIANNVLKALPAAYPNGVPSGPPNYVRKTGEQGYSFTKALMVTRGILSANECPEEVDVHNRLVKICKTIGHTRDSANSMLIPIGTQFIPNTGDGDLQYIREKTFAGVQGYDPDEARWMQRKALGTTNDAAGGMLVGFPTLGELIDLQRNKEAFVNAGASEITLPGNARLTLPKLTGGATAYWVGESIAITDSNQTTGQLALVGKKLGILVKMNNELLRYAGPTTEGMVRNDMARQGALAADLSMLQGGGGTQIKGLITYDKATSWTQGTDKLLEYTASTTGTDGNTFEPQDVYGMEALLPDEVEITAWMGRRQFWANIMNRRAAAVTAADNAGPFLFDITRSPGLGIPQTLAGAPIVKSSQISNTREKGSGTDLTYVLTGYFPDFVIGRFGIAEFATTNTGDTAFVNDQTWVRMIQTIDAGPRHPASFVFCDDLIVNP